jgi:anti-sigma regulatory factor (Ser/Thr protein kinase)
MGFMWDIIKFLVSPDFRGSVKSLSELAKASKNWQKDFLIYTGEFDDKNERKVHTLAGETGRVLTEKGWDIESISSLNFTLTELVRNGIEHSKSKDKVKCKVEICSNYCTIEVVDKGIGFDLVEELKKQNALDENSRECTALGVIYRMMTSFSQTRKGGKNIIHATLLKGYKYCRAYTQEQITVFEFNSEVSIDGYFWTFFINTIKSLKMYEKVIIYFKDLHRFATCMLREVNHTVYDYAGEEENLKSSLKIIRTRKEGNVKSTQVVICGNPRLNYALRNYLSANYEYFETLEDAIEFFKTGKKQKVIEGFTRCSNGHYHEGEVCPYCHGHSNKKIVLSPQEDWNYGINKK